MLKTRLELRGGFEVLAAEDSEKGCSLAASEHPDVILMDLEMPDDDRWEAVRRLKNDPQTRDIPTIGMSARAFESEREKAIAQGGDEFDSQPGQSWGRGERTCERRNDRKQAKASQRSTTRKSVWRG